MKMRRRRAFFFLTRGSFTSGTSICPPGETGRNKRLMRRKRRRRRRDEEKKRGVEEEGWRVQIIYTLFLEGRSEHAALTLIVYVCWMYH